MSCGRDNQGKFRNYTLLNNSRTHVLVWIKKSDKEVRWPTELNSNKASKQDRTKYYRFCEDHGHTIEEYRQLKDEIERLIRDGILCRFARKDREDRRPELEVRILENSNENEPVGVIHVIAGGISDCKGKNKRASKMSYLWNKNNGQGRR